MRYYWVYSLIAALLATPAPAAPAQKDSSVTLPPAIKINHDNRRRFTPHIARAAKKYRLEPALLHAMISVESGYNPTAVSNQGAMGLMQLMPQTAARFGVSDPFDPVANINTGARYLRVLLDKFGTVTLALAAYHAGEGRVARGRKTVPPILATRKYVVSVIHHYLHYRDSKPL